MQEQVARVHIRAPLRFDFTRLVSRVNRTGMMRVVAITLLARSRIEDGEVELFPTGQTFRWLGQPGEEPSWAERWMKVIDAQRPGQTSLQIWDG